MVKGDSLRAPVQEEDQGGGLAGKQDPVQHEDGKVHEVKRGG